MADCRYHPEVPGVGVCVRCRAVICDACCTRLRGVNHCHACLRELARPRPPSGLGIGSALAAVLLAALAWAVLFGVFLLLQGRLAP